MKIFILPFLSTLLSVCWFIFWLFAAVYIFSVGSPQANKLYPFMTDMVWDKNTRWVFLYHVFGLLWINSFIVGCTQFVIGASACIWYFEANSDSKGKGSVWTAMKWIAIYHWGSVAFGSLIIAIC